jgi:hypothetical protein
LNAGLAADAVLVLHVAFIAFVVAGGLLVLRRPRLAWLHVPCVVWGCLVEMAGWICPLTPLEVRLRLAAGEQGYSGGFVERYVEPIVYPQGLTRGMQVAAGAAVALANAAVYARLAARRRRSPP